MKSFFIYILIGGVFCLNNFVFAQKTVLKGHVFDAKNKPISFAVILNKTDNKFTYSDSKGAFNLQVLSFPCEVEFSILGYRTKSIKVSKSKELSIILQEESLELPGVVVTAKLRQSDNGSSSYILGNELIKQVQAMSVGDILTMVNGGKLQQPNMTSVQQLNLRTTEASNIDAFASKIMIDGVSLSNDANLQAYNPAQGIYGGKSAVGSGIDLRAITPESIEKIEVISGVPSVKYGNLASGTVLITRKVTPQDLSFNCSVNATNYQIGLHHGVQLSNDNLLSYSLSGTYATLSPTQRKDYYQALSGSLLWRTLFSKKYKWINTLSVSGNYGLNSKDFEEEDIFRNEDEYTNSNFSISSMGNLDVGLNIDYLLSVNLQKQYSFSNTKETNGPLPLVEGLETGTYKTPFSNFIYHLKQEIIGKPINVQAQINISKNSKWNNFHFSNKSGGQFSFDKNIGEGRIGGKSIVGQTGGIGSRAAKFKEIPALNTLSAYYENKTSYYLNDESYISLTSGIRYDNINAKYNLFSPRFSSYVNLSKNLKIRGTWGISYKAPALIHLYPGATYIDFTNMSFFSDNKKERMALITTHKIKQNNENLNPIKGITSEIGFDLEFEKYGDLKCTFFNKKIKGGIKSSPELLILDKQEYKVVQRYPDRMPDIAPIKGKTQKIMLTYNRMKNDITTLTQGIEITFNSKKIEATNTSFNLQLAFLKTTTENKAFRMVNSQYTIGDNLPRIGVYENPKKQYFKGSGSFTIVQHIPILKFIFTLRTELSFYDYYKYNASPIYPIGYYTRENKYITLSKEERISKEYKDLFLSKGEYSQGLKPPFYPNFHLQARKELKDGSSLQFYVQNFLWHTPSYEENGVRWSLNSDIYFGLGLTINL